MLLCPRNPALAHPALGIGQLDAYVRAASGAILLYRLVNRNATRITTFITLPSLGCLRLGQACQTCKLCYVMLQLHEGFVVRRR